MSAGWFMVCWIGFCLAVAGFVIAAMNYDYIAVLVLRMINAPVFPEARMVAALMYQHPEQWKADSYGMEHSKVGRMRLGYRSIEISGPFGSWEPNTIERRILWEAIKWYRAAYIKSLLVKALDEP